jgi:hypothetical protein
MSETVLTLEPDAAVAPRFWQIWGLIKQELIFLCWALMDVAIIAPFALFVMNWARFWNASQAALWLLLLILLPFNLQRLLSTVGMPEKRQWRILFVVFVVTMLLSWRGLLYAPRPLTDMAWLVEFAGHLGNLGNPLWGRDLTIFLFVLLAWWRGLRLSQVKPDVYRIGFRLRVGVLLLAPLAFLLHASGHLWGATPFVLLYFLAGLSAVSLLRAEQIEREQSGFAAGLTPGWVLTIFITTLLVVMTAGLFAAVVSGEAATIISGYLSPLWIAMLATIAVSLSTLLYLLSPLLYLFSLLIGLLVTMLQQLFFAAGSELPVNLTLNQNAGETVNDLLTEGEPLYNFALPAYANQILAVVVMLGLAALVTYFLSRYFRQPSMALPSGLDAVGSTSEEPSGGRFGDRLLRRLGLARRWRTAASIRRIYSEMCQRADTAGYPRGPAETPYEYLDTLSALWPDNLSEASLITDAYIRVRYGELPETEEELQAIKLAWQELSSIRPDVAPPSVSLK